MSKKDLVRNLCGNFCSYYKPSKEEELACRGFIVVEQMIKAGKKVSFEGAGKRPSRLKAAELGESLCPTCPFYERDCDYILQEGEARPCGGFIFLGLLLDDGIICIDDVRNIE